MSGSSSSAHTHARTLNSVEFNFVVRRHRTEIDNSYQIHTRFRCSPSDSCTPTPTTHTYTLVVIVYLHCSLRTSEPHSIAIRWLLCLCRCVVSVEMGKETLWMLTPHNKILLFERMTVDGRWVIKMWQKSMGNKSFFRSVLCRRMEDSRNRPFMGKRVRVRECVCGPKWEIC